MSSPDLFVYLLHLGDTTLILAQRLSEWCGKGPAFEEDMALANTTLDLLGQARLWLTYAGEVEGKGRDEDALAFLRDAHDFRNLLLVEQPNGDYAATIVRQFYFDAWYSLLLQQLTKSTDARIVEIAEQAVTEVTYHLRRSGDLVVRLTSDIDDAQDFVSSVLLSMVLDVLTLVDMLGVMLYLDFQFTVIALAVAPALFIVVRRLTKRIKKASREVKEREP